MSARALGLDVGEESTRYVAGRVRKGAFEIVRAGEAPTAELAGALKAAGLKGWRAMVGVTGRDMILRTTQVPPVPDWQLRELMKLEIAEVAEHAGDDLCADHGLLPGAARHGDQDFALLALVREGLLEQRSERLAEAGVSVGAFAPNAIALHNAAVAVDGAEGVTLVCCLDAATTDLALVEDGELLFARNLAGGLDLFEKAVGEALALDGARARAATRKLAVFPGPGEKLAGQQGTVARALEAPLRQVVGMLQSTVLLCKNQFKAADLRLGRVLLCGPGAELPGLDAALTRTLGVPVARFDPTEGYLVGEAEVPDGRGPDFAVATGLALMGTLPDAYRLEILTDTQRGRRRFKTRTVWLVAAAVLVLAHLVHAFVSARSNYELAERDVNNLRREVESRKADVRTSEHTAQEARELAARLAALEDLTVPGSGVLAALDLLDADLPAELWASSVRSTRAVEPEFARGTTRRPFIIVEGSGKEQSRSLQDAVTELTHKLREDPHVAAVKPRFSTNPNGAFSYSLSIDTSVVPGGAPAADDGAGDASQAAPGADATPAARGGR